MTETWKYVPGLEGLYEVSTLGSVRSLDRVDSDKNGRFVRRKGVLLRPAPSKSGHLSVVLGRKNGSISVHKLVAMTFLGPVPNGNEVLHSDHNPANNTLSNLRYGTRSENLKDDYESGVLRQAKPVVVRHVDGTEMFFRSISGAARHLGISQSAASIVLKVGNLTRYTKATIKLCTTT